MVEWGQEETFEILVLEDEVRIEPDAVNGGDERAEEIGPQINKSVGCQKSGRDGGFTVEPVILDGGVKCQKW